MPGKNIEINKIKIGGKNRPTPIHKIYGIYKHDIKIKWVSSTLPSLSPGPPLCVCRAGGGGGGGVPGRALALHQRPRLLPPGVHPAGRGPPPGVQSPGEDRRTDGQMDVRTQARLCWRPPAQQQQLLFCVCVFCVCVCVCLCVVCVRCQVSYVTPPSSSSPSSSQNYWHLSRFCYPAVLDGGLEGSSNRLSHLRGSH